MLILQKAQKLVFKIDRLHIVSAGLLIDQDPVVILGTSKISTVVHLYSEITILQVNQLVSGS